MERSTEESRLNDLPPLPAAGQTGVKWADSKALIYLKSLLFSPVTMFIRHSLPELGWNWTSLCVLLALPGRITRVGKWPASKKWRVHRVLPSYIRFGFGVYLPSIGQKFPVNRVLNNKNSRRTKGYIFYWTDTSYLTLSWRGIDKNNDCKGGEHQKETERRCATVQAGGRSLLLSQHLLLEPKTYNSQDLTQGEI